MLDFLSVLAAQGVSLPPDQTPEQMSLMYLHSRRGNTDPQKAKAVAKRRRRNQLKKLQRNK